MTKKHYTSPVIQANVLVQLDGHLLDTVRLSKGGEYDGWGQAPVRICEITEPGVY